MDRPRVTLKLATSLDGRIATLAGESRWITGEAARAEVQRMRAAHDAVLIGAETARRDDPSLLARTQPAPAKQPMRVVLTNRLDIPLEGRLFAGLDQSPLVIFARERASPARHAILTSAGAQIESAPALAEGLDVAAVLRRLGALGVRSVLAEGGGRVAASLIGADLVDRLEWFRAPLALGSAGKPAIADLSYADLAAAPRWRRLALRELGSDLWESYERA
jgi:diaminohydroxyphosphoribosylaminopyrimidine deaminase / 5-amino-6-(5-phosphoribosylamino)uracil reductase